MLSYVIPTRTLNDGLEVPAIGFGTANIRGSAGVNIVTSAIDNGYRLIDTAYNYENEGAVGAAIQRSEVPREQLRIASKLPGRYHRYDKATVAIQESLLRTGLDYFDLYLIHWPNPKQDHFVEAWQALIDAKKWGLVRSIGVSNFLPDHLDKIIDETGVTPSINQVELHPYFSQEDQRKADQKHGIVTESWSPLGRASHVLMDETIQTIAQNHKKTISQVILRWHIQLGALPLPKASTAERQKENLDLFDFSLSNEEMHTISMLTQPNGRIQNQDPAEYEEF